MMILAKRNTRLGLVERVRDVVDKATGGMGGQWHHSPETHYAPLTRIDVEQAKRNVDALFREYLGMSYAQLPVSVECDECSAGNKARVERKRRRAVIMEALNPTA